MDVAVSPQAQESWTPHAIEWEVHVDGQWVAGGNAETAAECWREAMHYAVQYASEGTATAQVFEVARRALPLPAPVDPRDPDPTREGIFRNHNCWKCREGAKPCVRGNPHRCEYPHARND